MRIFRVLKILVLLFFSLGVASCTLGNVEQSSLSANSLEGSTPAASPQEPPLSTPATSPLKVAVDAVTLYAGESYQLSVTGGKKPYSLLDSGTGFLDSLSYLYSTPKNMNPRSDLIQVTDASGASLAVNIKIRGFETSKKARSSTLINLTSLVIYSYEITSTNVHLVTGRVNLPNGSATPQGIILRSTDGGVTFNVIYETAPNGGVYHLKILSNGSLLIVTKEKNESGTLVFTVKKSMDVGMTWIALNTLPELYDLSQLFIGEVTGNIYITGYKFNEYDDRIGLIYRSQDSGQTWTLLSSLDYSSLASNIKVDTFGLIEINTSTLVVSVNVETYYSSSFPDTWIVQRSTDSGSTWTIVDNFYLSSTKDRNGVKLLRASDGTIFSIGQATNSSFANSVVVRKSVDNGLNWTTTNTYNYALNKSCYGTIATKSLSGKLWVRSFCYDLSNQIHIITRSSSDGSSWSLELDTVNPGVYSFYPGPLAED